MRKRTFLRTQPGVVAGASISMRYFLRWVEENLHLSGSNPDCSNAKGSFGVPRFLHPICLIYRYVIHESAVYGVVAGWAEIAKPYTIHSQLQEFANSHPILRSIIMLFMSNFAYACENKYPVSTRPADFFPGRMTTIYIR